MDRVVIKLYKSDKAFEGLKQLEDIEICGFTDSNVKLWDTHEKGYTIYSIFKVAELYKRREIDKVIFASEISMSLLSRMVKEACNLGINEKDLWIVKPEFYTDPIKENICEYKDYRRLPYIEFHVADHCNLNCSGCVHFSPLVKTEKYADYETVKRDLIQLKKLVSYIDKIHILGGEPFLNNELDRYIDLVHMIYPFSNIHVVTNGLLLKNMEQKLIESFRRNKAKIWISSYPPILDKIEEIITWVKDKGIEIRCSEPIYEFAYTFDQKGGHAEGGHKE